MNFPCASISSWRRKCSLLLYIVFYVVSFLNIPIHGVVVDLDSSNFDSVIAGADVVFINFYADWCRFSQILKPVFEEASNKVKDTPPGKVTWASVDCDRHSDIAQKHHISKYPTLKMFRNGQMSKREYRGQRSVESLANFIEEQLKSPIKEFASVEDLESRLDKNKRNVIGYFSSSSGAEWENYQKIGSNLRSECDFYVGVGEPFTQQTMGGNNVAFRPQQTENEDQLFSGNMGDYDYFSQWITDKCIPLVREITFENAEELTEEGLPFLILFRKVDDTASLEAYTQEVVRQLSDMKTSINCLTADGKKFAHPLHHLGKAENDLPILAIDSFRHMYLFPSFEELTAPGKLRQFVQDLHSGKLHREFHHGPDSTTEQAKLQPPGSENEQQVPQQQETGRDDSKNTDPPESVFKQLKPSDTRYTLLKDELERMDFLKRCSGTSFCAFTRRCQIFSCTLLARNNLLPDALQQLPYVPFCSVRHVRPVRQSSHRMCHTSCSIGGESELSEMKKKSLYIPSVVQFHLDKLQQDISDTLTTLHDMSERNEFSKDTHDLPLHKVAKYYFQQSGKLFRPTVCLTMAAACTQTQCTSSSLEQITTNQYKISVIAEMVHTASLVHDDVIDESDQRRNQPTVNAIWGNKRAVLVGDFILAKSTQLLASIGDAQVIALLAQIIEDLVRGEFMQMGVRNSNAEERFLHYMIKTFKKTASLFAHSCKAVAHIAGCNEIQQQTAFEYGRHIGLAFQLIDDLLDFVAKASDIGKPAATDLKLGLATAPVLFAAQQHPELDKMILRRFSQSGDVDKAWNLVINSDGLKRTKDLAKHHVHQAIKHIESLANVSDDFREALTSAAQVQLTRER